MTDVPPDVFVKKIVAEETLPRSGRQITRDISSAIRRRDVEMLACFQLRTLDGQSTDAVDIPDADFVKQLGADGKGPEWYADLGKYRIVLDKRARRRRPRLEQPSEQLSDSPMKSEEEVLGGEPDTQTETSSSQTASAQTSETPQQPNPFLTALLDEKDNRIQELKDSKQYLENLLEKLIGKDTLKALAEIVGNENVNSNQLVSLIDSTTKPADTKPEIEFDESQSPPQTKIEKKPSEVIDIESPVKQPSAVKAKKAVKTKNSTAKKLIRPKKKNSKSKSGKPKPSNQLKWYEKPITIPFLNKK